MKKPLIILLEKYDKDNNTNFCNYIKHLYTSEDTESNIINMFNHIYKYASLNDLTFKQLIPTYHPILIFDYDDI